ncbi:DgyrCDS8716 [Dimorphilus gyrociliatus]|uniref:glutathione transferase n=1 Tax=Dimorphilus gyrociliatus TaxID=2664684 RepID=A0A7I8VW07_9ANNE|nr:DgyrCDS8716 [Dimorphilus gyrociliatus]
MAPTLGYWNIKGLAQQIRLLLKYCNVEFEDKVYDFGPGPDRYSENWLKDKFNLGLDFPNLPYYIDGDVKLTQSKAIMAYIAKKYGLFGKTPEEEVKVYFLMDEIADFNIDFIKIGYVATDDDNYQKMIKEYLSNLDSKLEKYEKYLSKNESGKWLLGENISCPDFNMYEVLDKHRFLKADVLDNFPTLNAYMANFENIPSIKEYMSSKEFIKWPLCGPMSKFGS